MYVLVIYYLLVIKTNLNLIHANFFFVDIVGLSNPKMSTKTQTKKIEVLNQCIQECNIYKQTPKDMILTLPSGDGMALGFLQGIGHPIQLAIELHNKLAQYNKARIPSEIVQVRIGLHSGNCFVVNDIDGNKNIWGPGIILARRVMDLGDAGHVLLSPTLAEDLRQISDKYMKIVHPVGDEFAIKHGQTLQIYSAYGDGFGNSLVPTRLTYQKRGTKQVTKQETKQESTSLYPFVELSLTIKDPKTMLVHHKRVYQITNTSDTPIYYVEHGVAMDVPKQSFDDLNLSVYDEDNLDLTISDIKINEPYQKQFTTAFNKPILKNQSGRFYMLEYDVEEPESYFENAFLIDCKKLVLKIEYPKNGTIKDPVFYEIDQETEEKRKSKIKPTIRKSGEMNVARWSTTKIAKGQTFRVEW